MAIYLSCIIKKGLGIASIDSILNRKEGFNTEFGCSTFV